MKAFFLLLVLALAGAGAYQFHFKDHPIAWLQGPEAAAANTGSAAAPAPAAKKDFKDLSALLQGDMDHVPRDLHDTRQLPAHAFDVKARVAPHLQEHDEYRTLTQVCDTIIGADQDFSERQGKCGLGQLPTGANAQEKARASAGPNTAVYQQQQPLWDSRRRQADNDVRQKLATLENHWL